MLCGNPCHKSYHNLVFNWGYTTVLIQLGVTLLLEHLCSRITMYGMKLAFIKTAWALNVHATLMYEQENVRIKVGLSVILVVNQHENV